MNVSFNKWLKIKINNPIFALIFITASIVSFYSVYIVHKEATDFHQTIKYIARVVQQGIIKNDREIIELAFSFSLSDLRAKSVFLCKGHQEVMWRGSYHKNSCAENDKTPLLIRTYRFPIFGVSDTYLVFHLTYFSRLGVNLFTLGISIVTILFLVIFSQKIRNSIQKDIILPLVSNLTNSKGKRETTITELNQLLSNNQVIQDARSAALVTKEINHKMNSVIHDIKSPLAALNSLRDLTKKKISENERTLLDGSVVRIHEIITSLDHKINRGVTEQMLIIPAIESIVSEKRLEYFGFKIKIEIVNKLNAWNTSTIAAVGHFHRIISNIINNSSESILANKKHGNIVIELSSSDNNILISIKDNGSGISAEHLPKVFSKGFSHGKKAGTGLGLFQAKEYICKWGGTITVESNHRNGTTVTIKLNQCTPPLWLLESIDISHKKLVLIVDDDENMKNIWEQKLNSSRIEKIPIKYFSNAIDFINYCSIFTDTHSSYLLLIDYDLGSESMSGLDVIDKIDAAVDHILVTGNYKNQNITNSLSKLRKAILPKTLISSVPVTLQSSI